MQLRYICFKKKIEITNNNDVVGLIVAWAWFSLRIFSLRFSLIANWVNKDVRIYSDWLSLIDIFRIFSKADIILILDRSKIEDRSFPVKSAVVVLKVDCIKSSDYASNIYYSIGLRQLLAISCITVYSFLVSDKLFDKLLSNIIDWQSAMEAIFHW